jgi:hypothetical protein
MKKPSHPRASAHVKKTETKPIYNDLISIFVAKNINLVDTFSPVQKSGNYY